MKPGESSFFPLNLMKLKLFYQARRNSADQIFCEFDDSMDIWDSLVIGALNMMITRPGPVDRV